MKSDLFNELFITYDRFISDSNLMIHIDPGHGGIINNVYTTAPSKMWKYDSFTFYEGVFNRAMANCISEHLLTNNISHAFTTDTNHDVSLPVRISKAKNFKVLYPEKKHLFLSLHANAATVKTANGIEVWTMVGKSNSDVVASNIWNSLSKMGWKMRHDKTDGDPDKESRFYVLKHGELIGIDSVLIEYGFFTNEKEAKLLLEKHVQDELAKFTVEGILKSYNN